MSGAKTGALVRSIEAMTAGVLRNANAARDRYALLSLGEIDQQFHLPVSGVATQQTSIRVIEVVFDAPFIDAYDERQSPYEDPTFTSGVYMRKGDGVFFAVSVRQWVVQDGFYTGAVVAVAAYVPTGTQQFVGEIHLNFQGYGAPAGDESDEGDAA